MASTTVNGHGAGNAHANPIRGEKEQPGDTANGTQFETISTRSRLTKAFYARTRTQRMVAYVIVGVLILVLIVVGAVVGTQRREVSNNSGNSNGNGNGNGNGNQPSSTMDPRLHNSFWGMAYTPYGAIDCTATQANVTKDIMQLSQLTTRLRLYAADCNVTSLVVQAIEDLRVNMSVYAGIYVHPDAQSYLSQVAQLDNTFAAYGPSRILGVTVGNEYILNAQSRGDNTVNASSWLVSRIIDYKTHLVQLTASSTNGAHNYTAIPVGSSDAAGAFLNSLLTSTDYLFVNIHPWFSQNTYEQAAWFSWSYMQNIVMPLVNPALTAAPTPTPTGAPAPTPTAVKGPELFQGEFGWPTGSDSAALGVNPAGSPAGLQGMQRVLDDWVCASNRNGTKYFWFEAFDEPWKAMYGGVEQHWGLFDSSGNLKNITIPDCPHS